MTVVVLLAWSSLLIPGYAIARRVDAEGVDSGLMSAIALSSIAAASALSLVAIPCYLLGMPLFVLSAAFVGLVLWGIVDLGSRGPGHLGRLAVGVIGLELLIVAVDLVMSARVGTILGADAIVHVGRVRFLLEHGLVNDDPFVTGSHFYPIYHTNLLHALLASVAQLTGRDPATIWFGSLVVAKLLVVSGGWYAGWAIFRSRAAAWMTAIFLLGARGPVLFTLYPNQLAPWFLLPVLLGFVVRAIADGPDRRHAIGIAATTVVMGQTHAMYVVFVAMSVAPAVAIWALVPARGRSGQRRAAIVCAGAMLVAVPFPLVTYAGMKRAAAAGAETARATRAVGEAEATRAVGEPEATRPTDETPPKNAKNRTIETSNRIRRFDNGWAMHKLGRGFTGSRGVRVPILVMAGAMMVLAGRRREMLVLLAVLLAVAAWLHVPPLFTLFLKAGGAEWIVHRFGTFQDVIFALMVPGSLVAIAERAIARADGNHRLAWMLLRWGAAGLAFFAGAHFAAQRRPYTWPRYVERARETTNQRTGRELRPLLRLGADLRAHVPAGAVVLAEPSVGMRAVMAHDCRIVASTRSSTGVPDLRQRRDHIKAMLRSRTDDAERETLLERYGVTHVLVPRPVKRWAYERMSEFWTTEHGWGIVALRPAGEPPGEVLGEYEIALLDVGRFEEAIPRLQLRAAKRPEHFGTRFSLGNALEATGRVDEAVDVFREAQKLRPDDPRPSIMIGNCLVRQDRLPAAIDAYRATLDIAERTGKLRAEASAWFNIANIHFRLAEWHEALVAYERALAANPDHPNASYWRGEAERRLVPGAAAPDERPEVDRGDDDPPPRAGNDG